MVKRRTSASRTSSSNAGTCRRASGSSVIVSSASGGSGGVRGNGERLRAVALLVLLARTAPTRVVAADVLELGVHLRLGRDGRRDGAAAATEPGGRGGGVAAGGEDRVGAGERLVLVAERAVAAAVRALGLLQLGSGAVVGGHLGVEEERHDLLPNCAVQRLEHRVPLVAVLDERV